MFLPSSWCYIFIFFLNFTPQQAICSIACSRGITFSPCMSCYLPHADIWSLTGRAVLVVGQHAVHMGKSIPGVPLTYLYKSNAPLQHAYTPSDYNICAVCGFPSYGCRTSWRGHYIHSFLSASLYFSKWVAYWDRLCRDVVGRWLVVTRVHCGQTVHPRPIVTMEH